MNDNTNTSPYPYEYPSHAYISDVDDQPSVAATAEGERQPSTSMAATADEHIDHSMHVDQAERQELHGKYILLMANNLSRI